MNNTPELSLPAGVDPGRIAALFAALSSLRQASIEPGAVTAALAPLGNLPPFLRSLMVADGTVTMAMEAYFGEPIRIVTAWQSHHHVPCAIPALAMASGDGCFIRHVALRGGRTGSCYARATSLMNPVCIEPRLFAKLADERVGIGVILRNEARGSFREVLRVQRGALVSDFEINRTYRVSLAMKPALLITEEFSLPAFA